MSLYFNDDEKFTDLIAKFKSLDLTVDKIGTKIFNIDNPELHDDFRKLDKQINRIKIFIKLNK